MLYRLLSLLMDDPWFELVDALKAARALLALPENDFAWSSWEDASAATGEIDRLITEIIVGRAPDKLQMEVLFAATGPIQEVSLCSGWADEFLALAARFDSALAKAYRQ